MVYQRCTETGCTKAPRCGHRWYLHVEANGQVERGPVTNYAEHWDPALPLPDNKTAATVMEERVRDWLVRGRGPLAYTWAQAAAPVRTGHTWRDVIVAYRKGPAKRLTDNSLPGQLAYYEAQFGTRPMEDLLSRPLAREFLDEIIDDGWKGSTANRWRATWSRLITFAMAEFTLRGESPFHHKWLNPGGLKKYDEGSWRQRRLIDDEEDRLERACEALDDGGMMLGRFYCALDTGLRRGEMLALTRHNVIPDKDLGVLLLKVEWHTAKTKRERLVPVTSKRLTRWLKQHRTKFAEHTFGTLAGERIAEFRTAWENVLIAADISKGHWLDTEGHWQWDIDGNLHWHDLRHECGSRLAQGWKAEKPVPIHEVKDLLGHTSLETTKRYLNTTLASMAENMKRVHRAMGK